MNPSLSGAWPVIPRDGRGRPLDVIELRRLTVQCIVGMYPAERDTPQPLELDAALYLDTREAGLKGRLQDTVDYARLTGELRFLLETANFRMLETAAEALCRYLLAPPTADAMRAPLQAVTLRLSKPEALGRTAQAALCVHRTADEYHFEHEEKPFGRVDILFQDEHVGIYRLRIAPGRTIVTHEHRVMEEAELVLGAGLLLQGQPVLAGTGLRWPRHLPHRYDNPREVEQTVLCVDRPAFIPSDEVEVPEPAEGLAPVQGRAYYPEAANLPETETRKA
ncbi:dihydroneopterin aldolase [Archangium primigenium]|uniref:dihydroneopterin aldolase n=1 Tax=[Archangium] primigenium TaxID=2792470 RepID=UPI001958324E|nr:dihydroneopterin aldolase [Archangium primigenium]MBM7115688.1 dihydroneopterin aldolase [Archangium primigenium]